MAIRASSALATVAMAILLGSSFVSAQPALDYRSQLHSDIAATKAAAVVEFPVIFTLKAPAEVYLKVSPAPGNLAFGNGEAGKSGWWTEVSLDGPSGSLFTGQTAGDPPLQFGSLEANTSYTLHLRVHAPAKSLTNEGAIALEYILAQHIPSTSGGSGGTFDESTGLHATINVLPGSGVETSSTGIAPVWMWGIAALAGVALIVVGVVIVMRRGRGKSGGPGPEN
ncbi:MAG: hypothetical protein QOJ26_1885 [Thermoplasmata archaeon]|jgi:hypothetical protein|nr:hypothetical protein [Thermoplasmata archaeon]